MVATGYNCDAHPVIHELDQEALHEDEIDEAQQLNGTPRLEIHVLFFGDTFSQPLDILLDTLTTNKRQHNH